jgi:hypothetical protein
MRLFKGCEIWNKTFRVLVAVTRLADSDQNQYIPVIACQAQGRAGLMRPF